MQQSGTERVLKQAWLGGKGDPLGTVPVTKILPHLQVVHAQTRNCPRA